MVLQSGNGKSSDLSGYNIPLILSRPMDLSDRPIAAYLLHDYCKAHDIPRPGCLCPLKDLDRPSFMEASITLINSAGPYSDEYVAECSTGFCGYLGMCFLRCRMVFSSLILPNSSCAFGDFPSQSWTSIDTIFNKWSFSPVEKIFCFVRFAFFFGATGHY